MAQAVAEALGRDTRAGLGHGNGTHGVKEYGVIEGNGKVVSIVPAEQSCVDTLYAYA